MSRENMFRINIDSDSVIEFEELVLRKESEELSAKREALHDRLGSALHKSIRKGIALHLIPYITAMIGLFFLMVSVKEYFDSGALLVVPSVIAMVLLCAAAIIFVICRKRDKENDLDTDIDRVNDEYGVLNELVKKELGVPESARAVEIFTDMYSDNAEHSKVYTNDEAYVFEEDGKLCFFYGSAVLGFPMSELEAVVRLDAPVSFESWNKDIPYNRGDYMQYKIEQKIDGDDESYSMMGYYSVRFTHCDSLFEIIIPLYDIAPILEILKTEPIKE